MQDQGLNATGELMSRLDTGVQVNWEENDLEYHTLAETHTHTQKQRQTVEKTRNMVEGGNSRNSRNEGEKFNNHNRQDFSDSFSLRSFTVKQKNTLVVVFLI